jgi:hypothetical protein
MFCKNCGRQIPDNAAFCPACSTKRSGGDTFGDERSGRDIKNLPNYTKENELNRSGDAIDSDRKTFSLSDSGQKKFSLSDSGQKKFSLSGSGQKKFSLSDKGRDSGDGIVRISASREPAPPPREPTGFVNPLKDSGKTVFRDEPAAKEPTAKPEPEQPAAPGPDVQVEPEQPAGNANAAQSAVNDFYNGSASAGNDAGASSGPEEQPTGFVNPFKGSGQNIQWGSDGDRNETKNSEFAGDPREIETHLGFAIFTTLCCCQPTGIVAIIFSVLVTQEVNKGNYEQAQKYSNLAKIFCWISIILGLLCGGGSSLISSFEEIGAAASGAAAP